MLTSILLPGLIGFVWGVAVSFFNNFWTCKAFADPKSKKATVLFVFRQGINCLAMFLVYKNTAMLVGTALGLLAIKNYILIKGITDLRFQKRKG